MGIVTIGVDVGQKRDPTALCVAEPESRAAGERVETHFLIRHLERLPLGTPYPRVAQRVARITDQVTARTGESPTVFVDATGVGQPVLDILARAIDHCFSGKSYVMDCLEPIYDALERGGALEDAFALANRMPSYRQTYLSRSAIAFLSANRLEEADHAIRVWLGSLEDYSPGNSGGGDLLALLIEQGDSRRARRLVVELEKYWRPDDVVESYSKIAQHLFGNADRLELRRVLVAATRIASAVDDPLLSEELLRELADLHKEAGDPWTAAELKLEGRRRLKEALARRLDEGPVNYEVLLYLQALVERGDDSDAWEGLQALFEHLPSQGAQLGSAEAITELVSLLDRLHGYAVSRHHRDRLLALVDKIPDETQIGPALVAIATLLSDQGEYRQARITAERCPAEADRLRAYTRILVEALGRDWRTLEGADGLEAEV